MMVVEKALYGLRTSGARFHAKFADTLRSLGFTPTYADPDVWMRDAGDCYEYVCVYVDDILTALKNPEEFYKALTSEPYNYILKNVEEPKYHLGGNFFRDKDGTFCYGSNDYVKRLTDNYKMMFCNAVIRLLQHLDAIFSIAYKGERERSSKPTRTRLRNMPTSWIAFGGSVAWEPRQSCMLLSII